MRSNTSQGYDPVRDFQAVSKLTSNPYIICVAPNLPVANIAELIAMARKALSFLPQADQDWIFHKTALKLYPALAKK